MALAGIDEPEAKRKTIGRAFIEVFDGEEAHKLTEVDLVSAGHYLP